MNPNKRKYLNHNTSQRPAEEKVLAAFYHRVSTQKQADEQTIRRQQAVTKELFERKLHGDKKHLIGDFVDEAYNFEAFEPHRAFWSELVPRIEAGEVNTVIAVNPDRIFRGASAQLKGQISDLFYKHRVRLLTANSDFVYERANTSGMIVDTLTQTLGAKEKAESVAKMHSGRRRRLEEDAEFRVPIVPFAYRLGVKTSNKRKSYIYTVDDTEAAVVQDIYALYIGKPAKILPSFPRPIGTTRIAELLNLHGVSRKEWKESVGEGWQDKIQEEWDKQQVLRILTNPTYMGKLTVVFRPTNSVIGFEDKATVKELDVPAIVSEELFEQAGQIHSHRRHNLVDNWTERTTECWLHGVVRCLVCGEPLIGFMSSANIRYYKCTHSTAKASHGMHRCEDVEKQVESKLMERAAKVLQPKKLLSYSAAYDKTNVPVKQLEALERAIGEKQKELKRLNTGYLQGLFDGGEFKELKADVGKALAKLEKQKTELTATMRGGDEKKLKNIATVKARLQEMMKGEFAEGLEGESLRQAELLRAELLLTLRQALVKSVELERLPMPELENMELEEIKPLYEKGFVTAKQVRDALGWTPKKLIGMWGKSARKKRIDVKVKVRWERG